MARFIASPHPRPLLSLPSPSAPSAPSEKSGPTQLAESVHRGSFQTIELYHLGEFKHETIHIYLERVHECDDCDSYFLKRDRIVDMGAFPAALVCDALVIL